MKKHRLLEHSTDICLDPQCSIKILNELGATHPDGFTLIAQICRNEAKISRAISRALSS
jgi:hypothetical protein